MYRQGGIGGCVCEFIGVDEKREIQKTPTICIIFVYTIYMPKYLE